MPLNEKVSDALHAPVGWLLHLVALLPFGMLYLLADFIYLILYYVVGYRKKVARQNMSEAFPEKSGKEITATMRLFYRWLADYMVETIKLLHISNRQIRSRFVFKNMELVDSYFDQGRSIVAYAAHYCNWEWIPSITLWSRHGHDGKVFAQIYRPLKSRWADSFLLNLRKRFGSVGLPKKTAFRHLIGYKRDGVATITGFMSDQHPSHGDPGHITRLLNHDTAMITGTETLARRLGFAVVYFEIYRPSRGHYVCTMRDITASPQNEPQGAITERYTRMLENQIRTQPEVWLWTHKRWKKKVTLTPETGESNGNSPS